MAKRIAFVGVVSFVLVAACGAVCQNVGQSIPDAPSMQAATHTQKFNVFGEEARSPLKFGAMSGNAGLVRQGAFGASEAASGQEKSSTIFEKYLNSPSLRQQSGYRASSGDGLMSRATYAGSSIFVTRDASGKGRLNTSYLLRALTSVAADTASRPYWRRSFAEPFSDFGSTVGNDAGMNLWREFRPGIEQLMKSHTPKFVSKIEARIGHK